MRTSSAVIVLGAFAALCATASARPRPVTEEQMQKAFKMIRNVCQPKSGVPDDVLDSAARGEMIETQPMKCYMSCAMTTVMTMKGNKIDTKMLKKQAAKMLLEDLIVPFNAAVDECSGVPAADEPCQTAWNFFTCLNPKIPTTRLECGFDLQPLNERMSANRATDEVCRASGNPLSGTMAAHFAASSVGTAIPHNDHIIQQYSQYKTYCNV